MIIRQKLHCLGKSVSRKLIDFYQTVNPLLKIIQDKLHLVENFSGRSVTDIILLEYEFNSFINVIRLPKVGPNLSKEWFFFQHLL